jgi:hypothetical protein
MMIIECLEMLWMEAVAAYFKVESQLRLQGLRKVPRRPGRDSKQASPEYKLAALQLELTSSVGDLNNMLAEFNCS